MMKVDTKAILTVEADAVEQVGQEYVELFMENGFMNEEELYTLRNVYLNEAYHMYVCSSVTNTLTILLRQHVQ